MKPKSDPPTLSRPAADPRVTDHAESLPGSPSLSLLAPGRTRIDAWLAAVIPDSSRSQIQRWIDQGAVTIQGLAVRPSDRPASGTLVEVRPPEPAVSNLIPESTPLQVLYEDDDLLVVDKSAGMVVHPGAGAHSGTLVHALLGHSASLSEEGGADRPGIVHRLDKDTSGLLVVAKNDSAHRSLAAQIAARTASRQYRVIVWGNPSWEQATIRADVGRDPNHRTRMAVLPDGEGRSAETHLLVKERFPLGSVLEASLKTGRTHQIRLHCAYAGLPVVGDPVYGDPSRWLQQIADRALQRELAATRRQALHAWRLTFEHPRTREVLQFESEPPADWQAILRMMQRAHTGRD